MSHLTALGAQPVTAADVNRLMLYHDRQFVELAYRLILRRPADDEGLAHYLGCLRSGLSRREIVFRLGNSAEAREGGFDKRLLGTYRLWRRIESIPLLGTLLLILICLVRFKRVVKEFRRVQNAVFGGLCVASVQVSK